MAAEIPKDARNLLQTIRFQIESIEVDSDYTNDEALALNQQLAELQEWKQHIEADPSSASLKRPAAEAVEEAAEELMPKRRKLGPRLNECSTCMEYVPVRQMARMKCCGMRYCMTCFQEWFTAALDTK